MNLKVRKFHVQLVFRFFPLTPAKCCLDVTCASGVVSDVYPVLKSAESVCVGSR